MSFNLGFIGGGNMSSSIVKGILRNDSYLASKIWVSGPRLYNLKHWRDLGTNVTIKNGEVFSQCDVIFLGVKPGMLSNAVNNCLETFSENNINKPVLLVSMLAGVSINDLHMAFKVLSNNIHIIRIMPNTPMAVGSGTCLYTPDESVTQEECDLLEKLLSGCGTCERIPENLISSLGCLTACGPAFMYIIIEALADGAVKQGVPRNMALRMAAQTMVGSGTMVLESGKHPGLLKDEVCSPGGTTICGVAALENGGLRATLMAAVEAATTRTKELGKKL